MGSGASKLKNVRKLDTLQSMSKAKLVDQTQFGMRTTTVPKPAEPAAVQETVEQGPGNGGFDARYISNINQLSSLVDTKRNNGYKYEKNNDLLLALQNRTTHELNTNHSATGGSNTQQYLHPQTLTGILMSRDVDHDSAATLQKDYNLDSAAMSKITWRLGLLAQEEVPNQATQTADSLEDLEKGLGQKQVGYFGKVPAGSLNEPGPGHGASKHAMGPASHGLLKEEEGESAQEPLHDPRISDIFNSIDPHAQYDKIRQPAKKSTGKKVTINL